MACRIQTIITLLACVSLGLTRPVRELSAPDQSVVLTAEMVQDGHKMGDDFLSDDIAISPDQSLALVYKKKVVYQIPMPQNLVASETEVLKSDDIEGTAQTLDKIKHGKITLKEFINLTGIAKNADKVFKAFDDNADGILMESEILKAENLLKDVKLVSTDISGGHNLQSMLE